MYFESGMANKVADPVQVFITFNRVPGVKFMVHNSQCSKTSRYATEQHVDRFLTVQAGNKLLKYRDMAR